MEALPMSRRVSVFVVAFLLFTTLLSAQARVTIRGSVVDALLKPLAGVAVTLDRDGRSMATAVSSVAGDFTFSDVAPGIYTVRATLSGYPAFSKSLTVTAAMKSLQLPIVLSRPEDAMKTADMSVDRRSVSALPMPAPAPPPPPPAPVAAAQAAAGGGRGGGGNQGGVAGGVVGGVADLRMEQSIYGRPVMERDPWTTYPPQSGDAYASVEPNRFQRTVDHPLSTFGADVDTASYSNARRILSSGQLPPSEAIRVEEFVNYFRFAYDTPRDGRPMALTTEIGECPWAPSHKLVLVGARAALPAPREVSARNLVLLIDVSGSMQPQERLPLIKTALGMFVDTLQRDDHISIVTYAGTSGVALPPTCARQRNVNKRAIGALRAGRSPNGATGLKTA
jgi:Ca-activated chloride channel family protein